MSEQSFICIYCHSPSLTLLPELCLVSDQWQHWILIGAQALLWTLHARDLACTVLMRIIPKLSPPPHPWKNWYLVPKILGTAALPHWVNLKMSLKKVKEKWQSFSHVWLFAIPWTYTVHGILQARMLEWVAFPSSRGSSKPRDWTQVSHTAGRFFASWATREALCKTLPNVTCWANCFWLRSTGLKWRPEYLPLWLS